MNLRSLLSTIDLEDENGSIPDIEIEGLHFHSQKIRENDLFIAVSGFEADGHSFINDAVSRGAVVVIGEKHIPSMHVPYIRVRNSRSALAKLAQLFYQTSSKEKTYIGITGTNGKTTTAYMLQHILEQNGVACSRIGSVCHKINGETYPSSNTTPDPIELHSLLAKSEDSVVIIEVSSHGLDQGRVDGLTFDYALFTNLSHDHLDYHETLDNYFEAKYKLFTQLHLNGEGIVNAKCPWGKKLSERLRTNKQAVYTIGNIEEANVMVQDWDTEFATLFEMKEGNSSHPLQLQVPGMHNRWNASLSFLAARRLGIHPTKITDALQTFHGVPGRFETYIDPHKGVTCVVDYAHTPDALLQSLQTIKQAGAKRILHLFGFRGNGDPSKRRKMLELSSEMSDVYILTLDDLGKCTPMEMTKVLEQMHQRYGNEKGFIIPDRTLAIQHAYSFAKEGDWIFISGKGPEPYKQPFSLQCHSDMETVHYVTNQQ